MKSSIRGVILGTVGLVIAGLAGCEDNEKNAAGAFKDTKSATREMLEQQTKPEDMAKRYSGGGAPYGGGGTYRAAQKQQRR
jgi:hypothetical protein